MSRSNHYDLLLDLLERAASRDGLRVSEPRTRTAVAALEAEALIERRSGVFRATATGTRALDDRGRGLLPAGELAVLFTDMEGSTQLIERFGELDAHALLKRHLALLRASVAEHRGHEIKSLGDGLMVVFEAGSDAVACAADMQAAVMRDDQPLGLRIGIHVGEPMREAGDYFGTPVIIARRLCDTAHPGQTLVSESALQQIAEHEVDSLDELALKGMSKRVRARALSVVRPEAREQCPSVAV